jgi:hypothetical protein
MEALLNHLPPGPLKDQLLASAAEGRAKAAAESQAYVDEKAAAARLYISSALASPPAPVPSADSVACDALSCRNGLAWQGPVRDVKILSCGRCKESHVCSKDCQREVWGRHKHKAWCHARPSASDADGQGAWTGPLPPPRPLRLMHRVITDQALAQQGLRPTKGDPSVKTFPLVAAVPCDAADIEENLRAAGQGVCAPKLLSAAEALSQFLAGFGGRRRLVLVVPHIWQHFHTGSGRTRPHDCTVFDVMSAGQGLPLDGPALIALAARAMAYMFHEEDRLVGGDEAYGVGLTPDATTRVGPATAERIEAMRVAALSALPMLIPSHVLPIRIRVAPTTGPFEVGEDALETVHLWDLTFHRPGGWPEGWLVCTAGYRNFLP